MKRFIVFAGDFYYPGGGMADLVGNFDTLDEARWSLQRRCDWFHILDTTTGEVYETNDSGNWVIKSTEEFINS